MTEPRQQVRDGPGRVAIPGRAARDGHLTGQKDEESCQRGTHLIDATVRLKRISVPLIFRVKGRSDVRRRRPR